jgi:hypothetical protein
VVAFMSAGAVVAALGVRAVFALGGAGLVVLAIAGCLAFRPARSAGALTPVREPAPAG